MIDIRTKLREEMAAVVIRRRSVVQNSRPETVAALGDTFRLGAIDITTFPLVANDIVFIYKKEHKATEHECIPPHKLKKAVSRLLDYYPQLTGRFTKNLEDNSYQINSLGKGVDFVEATLDEDLSALIKPERKEHSLVVTDLPHNGQALVVDFEWKPSSANLSWP